VGNTAEHRLVGRLALDELDGAEHPASSNRENSQFFQREFFSRNSLWQSVTDGWPQGFTLVLSEAVLVLETTFRVTAIVAQQPTCRCVATRTLPLDRLLGLASEEPAWNCFAIQSD
jgi:hypothetical protein